MSINYANSLDEVGAVADSNPVTAQTIAENVPATAAFSVEAQEEWVRDTHYEWYDDYYDNTISTIDENKKITLGKGQINLSQEENSQYVQFEMAKKYDGFDLATTNISIHFDRKDGEHGSSQAVNVEYNETLNKIRFGWLIDGNATHVPGKLLFSVHADGQNSKGHAYRWKTKSCDAITIEEDLCITCDEGIVLDDSWVQVLVEKVAEKLAEANIAGQVEEANEAAALAKSYAEEAATVAEETTREILVDYATKEEVAAAIADVDVSDQLQNYATKTEVEEAVESVDVSEQLANYALKENVPVKISELENDVPYLTEHQDLSAYALKTEIPIIPDNVSAFNNDAGYLTEHQSLEAYALKREVPSIEGLASETYVDEAVKAVDVSAQLVDYAKKEDTYTKDEVDEAIRNADVDLTNYYTKTEVDNKDKTISDSVAANTSGVSSLNRAVAEINQTLEGIDDSPKVTYDATYGNVELDDGSTAEYMFTLWKTEGGVREVQDRFQILGGGGGSTSSVTLRIAYVDGYGTPFVATASDPVVLKYSFTGEDSAGDTNLDGVASWKVGNRVVATEDVATGEREFDLTEYVTTGDNKVVLTITHATGAMATKAWTIKIVDVRLESPFNDAKTVPANKEVSFAFTPYGGVDKNVHFILDGKEIDTKVSAASAAGLSDSFNIPAQNHGSHLFEIYMTATVNGKDIESNHIVKDILWYDEGQGLPVIGCAQQEFEIRQYEAINLEYTVYDPTTETPNVVLKSTYVKEDGEVVEEYLSNITMSSNTEIWQYKTDILGEHTLTIACGEVVKTLVATVVELGIEVEPITTGLVFDFNPVGYSNNDADRLWSYGDVNMIVSDNFDWVNGGYQYDENGDQYFVIKAGTSATINYELFGDDAKANGKELKLVFKTKNVSDSETVFLNCVSDTIGTDKIGLEMKAHEATIFAKTDSLPLPYAEEEIVEFEFNITPGDETPSMVMGYEDGVSTRPLIYDDTHDFQQYQGYRKAIELGSNDCDLCIYRFKVYSNSLSDRDILNNFIADARSADEMIRRHDRNQIYKEGVLDPDYLAEVCPDLRIIKLEVPHFTKDKDDKVYDSKIQSIVECVYKGGDPVYDNWVAYDIVHSGQGTSSNNYGPAGRNLDIIMKSYKDYGNNPYIVLGDGSQTNKVSLTRESIPTNYFNVKVNIASSENANNAVLAKRYDRYNPYKRPFVREDESIISHIKDTMEFQNCVIFLKESDTDLSTHVEFNDNLWHLYAIGNIGDSKKTDDSRLTDPSDPYECILEVMDNTLPNSTMPTGKVDEKGAPVYPIPEEEWCEGNSAYDSLHADKFDESKSSDKENGLADTYGWRYIYEDGTDEENAEAKAYVEQKWKDFYKFVVTSSNEDFHAHLGDWCVLDSVLYYYLFTLRYTLTDNHAKNSFFHYSKTGDFDSDGNSIRKWDLCFGYDFDKEMSK